MKKKPKHELKILKLALVKDEHVDHKETGKINTIS